MVDKPCESSEDHCAEAVPLPELVSIGSSNRPPQQAHVFGPTCAAADTALVTRSLRASELALAEDVASCVKVKGIDSTLTGGVSGPGAGDIVEASVCAVKLKFTCRESLLA